MIKSDERATQSQGMDRRGIPEVVRRSEKPRKLLFYSNFS